LEPPGEGLARIIQPEEVWPYMSVEFVAVIPLDSEFGVEVGYQVTWDEEHALGSRLRKPETD
jgi:hypothetical protein